MARCGICNSRIGIFNKKYRIAINSKKLTICSNCQDEMKIINEASKQIQPLISNLKAKIDSESENAILYYELGKLLLYSVDLVNTNNYEVFQQGDLIEEAYETLLTAISLGLPKPVHVGRAYLFLAKVEPIVQKIRGFYPPLIGQYIKNSLNELGKAINLEPDNIEVLDALNDIYTLTGQYDNRNAILAQIQKVRQREKIHSSPEEAFKDKGK